MSSTFKSKIEGVIFDLGSTLLEYETIPWDELSLQCVEYSYAFLKEKGFDIPNWENYKEYYLEIRNGYRKEAGRTLVEWNISSAAVDLLAKCGIDAGKNMVDKFLDAYAMPLARQVTMFADTPTVLRGLKASGMKIGLVSNTIFSPEFHTAELENYKLLDLFDFTIFSSSFGYRKPHRLIYRKAIELIGIPPEQLLFVGDRYIEDYDGPRKAGMNAIIKYREGRDYPSPMPDEIITIQSLSELLAILSVKISDKCR